MVISFLLLAPALEKELALKLKLKLCCLASQSAERSRFPLEHVEIDSLVLQQIINQTCKCPWSLIYKVRKLLRSFYGPLCFSRPGMLALTLSTAFLVSRPVAAAASVKSRSERDICGAVPVGRDLRLLSPWLLTLPPGGQSVPSLRPMVYYTILYY